MTQEHARPDGFVSKVIYYLGAAFMLTLFAVVLYSVAMRYLFNRAPLWSQDVPILLFTWMVFGIVGLTTLLGPEIRVTFFIDKLSARARRRLLVATHLAVLVMLVFLVIYSLPIIELSADETVLSTGWSGALVYEALPVGCFVIGFYQIRAIALLLRGRTLPKMPPGA